MTFSRDIWAGMVAVVLGLALLAAGAYSPWSAWAPPVELRLVPLVLVGAAEFLCRRTPGRGLALGASALAIDVALGPSLAVIVIVTDVLYAVGVYGSKRLSGWLLRVAVTVCALVAVGTPLVTHSPGSGLVAIVYAGLLLVVPVVTGLTVREQRDRAELQRLRAERIAQVAHLEQERALSWERARVARELHDTISNHLSAVAIHSSAGLSLLDVNNVAVRESLNEIRASSQRGLTEMRRLIVVLRDNTASPLTDPGIDAVAELVENMQAAGFAVTLRTRGARRELARPVEVAAYRIVQESLANALKHGGGGRTEVLIEHARRELRIAVDSPMRGGSSSSSALGTGTGLTCMRERVSLLGGHVEIGPVRQRWRVRASLPVSCMDLGAPPDKEKRS
ncbi:sensor histidine kinase [Actinomadura sp. WMMA1423]|uniref:sensor histidine kinase n=1 Tax=Actinomadura sp. WMMA1423 TaxID=2591108 RepID=UPI00143D5631|nr:histidine kinase [Actinomadura sp. WMMA1423]